MSHKSACVSLDRLSEREYMQHTLSKYGIAVCAACHALLWKEELPPGSNKGSICCNKGRVRAPPLKPLPEALQDLLTYEAGNTIKNRFRAEFLNKVIGYNSMYAFISIGANVREFEGRGIRHFTIRGRLHHLIGSLVPHSGPASQEASVASESPTKRPAFAQLYFYHPDQLETVKLRYAVGEALTGGAMPADAEPISGASERDISNFVDAPSLTLNLMLALETLLRNHNPYFHSLKTALQQARDHAAAGHSLPDMRIILRADAMGHDHRYQVPSVDEVAALLPGDGESLTDGRDIMIAPYGNSGKLRKVHFLNPLLDGLSFPLAFPFGDAGFRLYFPQIQILPDGRVKRGERNLTLRQFYSYRLMERLTQPVLPEGWCCGRERPPNYAEPFHALPPIPSGRVTFFNLGRLVHQMAVDWYARAEENALLYIRMNQSSLRSDIFQGAADALHSDRLDPELIGKNVYLPASFTGGPRYMHKRFQDAMALVREFGKPDLFLTLTCNPQWEEIRAACEHSKTKPVDRPDLTARVFHKKLQHLMELLLKKHVLGKVVAHCYVVEFQKRGLPHAHILLILSSHDKPTADTVDLFATAQIPDPRRHPNLFHRVIHSMVHGPCGSGYESAPCMRAPKNQPATAAKRCRFQFPKAFCETPGWNDAGFANYRRPKPADDASFRNAETVRINPSYGKPYCVKYAPNCVWLPLPRRSLASGVSPESELAYRKVTSNWIAAYNPILTLIFDAHLNVEISTTMASVKYLYKYVFKGHDKSTLSFQHSSNGLGSSAAPESAAAMRREGGHSGGQEQGRASAAQGSESQNQGVDETIAFTDARYISASEAYWRLFEFPIQGQGPSVQLLSFHLEGQQLVYFDANNPDSLRNAIDNPKPTMLLAWFELNRADPHARQLMYHEIPKHYRWDQSSRSWVRRVRRTNAIGRVSAASPTLQERYCLRMLLHHPSSKGATSHADIRTINGTLHGTYRGACLDLGLLDDDLEWDRALAEAADDTMPSALRQLFCVILVMSQPSDPLYLWGKYSKVLSEDFFHQLTDNQSVPSGLAELPDNAIAAIWRKSESLALKQIENTLQSMGRTLIDFSIHLPATDAEDSAEVGESKEPGGMDYNRTVRALSDYNFDETEELNKFELNSERLNEDQGAIVSKVTNLLDSVHTFSLEGDGSVIPPADLETINLHKACRRLPMAPPDGDVIPNIIFIDGPGGTGKTFVYETILAYARSKGKLALPVATSGLAATLLSGGRTAHSLFGIPLQLSKNSVCSVSAQSKKAQLLKHADIIIYDEVSMLHRYALEAIDRLLRDLHRVDLPFGNKIMLLGGDFRQLLPVVRRGKRAQITGIILKSSYLWNSPSMATMKLTINERVRRLARHNGRQHNPEEHKAQSSEEDPDRAAHSYEEFGKLLLGVGNGTYNGGHLPQGSHCSGLIRIPSEFFLRKPDEPLRAPPPSGIEVPAPPVSEARDEPIEEPADNEEAHEDSATPQMQQLIDFVFPSLRENVNNPEYGLCERVILTSRVSDALDINTSVMNRMPRSSISMEAFSSDLALDDSSARISTTRSSALFPPDVLHSLTPSGFPPHELKVMIGAPYVLLRNLNPAAGHSNGTRYIVSGIVAGGRLLQARAVTGPAVGRTFLIPRIVFTSTANDYPFILRRKQFPFQPAFAMTIHKAQGQTLQVVGIHVNSPTTIFSHGQLYVAMSRVGNPENLRIAVEDTDTTRPHVMNNIVYQEALA